MYLSTEVTRFPADTIIALMPFLGTGNSCVMMTWPVSINFPSSFSSFGIGASENVCVTDDFANHFRFRRIHVGWVANHNLRFGHHIASSAVAVNSHLRWRRCRWRYCGNFHRCRCCRHSLVSTWFQSRSRYSRIHFHVKIPFRPSSFNRFTLTPLFFRMFSAN